MTGITIGIQDLFRNGINFFWFKRLKSFHGSFSTSKYLHVGIIDVSNSYFFPFNISLYYIL